MKVLIACEESQRVCTEFRNKGHEAFSCDIQECSGGGSGIAKEKKERSKTFPGIAAAMAEQWG